MCVCIIEWIEMEVYKVVDSYICNISVLCVWWLPRNLRMATGHQGEGLSRKIVSMDCARCGISEDLQIMQLHPTSIYFYLKKKPQPQKHTLSSATTKKMPFQHARFCTHTHTDRHMNESELRVFYVNVWVCVCVCMHLFGNDVLKHRVRMCANWRPWTRSKTTATDQQQT